MPRNWSWIITLFVCCLSEHTRSVNGRQYRSRLVLIGLTAIAEPTPGRYVDSSEQYRPAGVSQRDQNASHLMVFMAGDASLLAR